MEVLDYIYGIVVTSDRTLGNAMRLLLFALALIAGSWGCPLAAQSLSNDPALATQSPSAARLTDIGSTIHYVVTKGATIYTEPDGKRPYVRLRFREPVYVLSTENGWSRIHTQDGARGYIDASDVSNVWIWVSKHRKRVYLYRGLALVLEVPADFGYNAILDKEKRGTEANPDHWRTPEGAFFVVRKNPYSQFYKALLLNYPNAEDAERGLRTGLINERQYESIMRADETSSVPPMNTALGGYIEIHGDGTGRAANWTQGCVAVRNDHLDLLWEAVSVGTPVIIEK